MVSEVRREGEVEIGFGVDVSPAHAIYAEVVKRKPDLLFDVAPVVVVLLDGVFVLVRAHPVGISGRLLGLALIADAVALALSARVPVLVLVFVLAVAVVAGVEPTVILAPLFALFALARRRERAVVAAGALLSAAVVTLSHPLHGHPVQLPSVIPQWVAIGLAVAVGLYVRARAEQVAGLAERVAAEERVRIARELHDVVAHNVSLMVVQAQALAATATDEHQRAGADQLADLGREAMAEMHRMLGVLRLDGAGPERSPQPGVAELEGLVARTNDAGVWAQLWVEGERRELPSAVDLSVYRIVQEALTNVVRHAHARRVDVTLKYLPRELQVWVVDDGAGEAGTTGGHGLVGMRERVALFGGTLRTGTRSEANGYQVLAFVPID